ncbi:hypothetical protein ACFFX0_24715 [Citricoccus parietis]|uniref:Uncharacterized protein n=1 Tax=Citricoccus parietis TaxID=592307 RepID=A0ABV5G5K0_9MICC
MRPKRSSRHSVHTPTATTQSTATPRILAMGWGACRKLTADTTATTANSSMRAATATTPILVLIVSGPAQSRSR